jgi:hypothetical protein
MQADEAYTCEGSHHEETGKQLKHVSPFLLSTSLTCATFTSYFVIIFQTGEVNVQFHYQEIHRQ